MPYTEICMTEPENIAIGAIASAQLRLRNRSAQANPLSALCLIAILLSALRIIA